MHKTSKSVLFLAALLLIAAALTSQSFQKAEAAGGATPIATYSNGTLRVTIPFHGLHPGVGQLTVEVLDPEDAVLGRAERRVDAVAANGSWREEIQLAKPPSLDDLVWHRVRYRFIYADQKDAALQGTESISQILRTPVVHVLGQQSYLTGGPAAVRVIVTDSKNEAIAGPGSVRIDLMAPADHPRLLFTGRLNRRGTTEAQFRFPAGLSGSYPLRYIVDTPIGSTEFTQQVRLEDKVSILLTTEKPIYQPGQTIHVRALALDRASHEAAAGRKLTFEVEDSRGNKVFKKVTQTDKFGIASAEFAPRRRSQSRHLSPARPDGQRRRRRGQYRGTRPQRGALRPAEIQSGRGVRRQGRHAKRGYRPGDHVTGTVRANYFFGKPVDRAEVTVKASGMDVARLRGRVGATARPMATAPIASTSSCPPTSPAGR